MTDKQPCQKGLLNCFVAHKDKERQMNRPAQRKRKRQTQGWEKRITLGGMLQVPWNYFNGLMCFFFFFYLDSFARDLIVKFKSSCNENYETCIHCLLDEDQLSGEEDLKKKEEEARLLCCYHCPHPSGSHLQQTVADVADGLTERPNSSLCLQQATFKFIWTELSTLSAVRINTEDQLLNTAANSRLHKSTVTREWLFIKTCFINLMLSIERSSSLVVNPPESQQGFSDSPVILAVP